MKRSVSVLIALGMMAAMLVALAAPALADDGDFFDRFDNNDLEDCFVFDGVLICDDNFDRDVEQDAESGDVDQSFDVSQTGDNSNQCVSTQGVANTGNTQNSVSLGLLGGDFDDDNGDRFFDDHDNNGDFEFDEVGSTIEVSPTNTTTCDQQVNQAASATG